MSDRLARLALGRLGEPGDLRLSSFVTDLGAEEVHRALLAERDLHGLESEIAARLRGLDPERDLEQAARKGIRFVVPGDDEWPEQVDSLTGAEPVAHVGGSPLGLWLRGPLNLAQITSSSVAVVGSRSATTYGTRIAAEIAADITNQGTTVVSGAAFGIDQAAHRGAIGAGGPTVAVLACGVDRAYPAAHRDLLAHIAETGLIVSELPPGTAPTRLRFLSRNRVIAALAGATVVVEAATRSGALNTANWAGRLNRVVMGVPGPVTSAPSAGVHQLIRTRDAQLVTCGAEVLELAGPVGGSFLDEPRGEETPLDRLPHVDRRVFEALPAVQAADEAALARIAGLSPSQVTSALPRLRALGLAESNLHGWRARRG